MDAVMITAQQFSSPMELQRRADRRVAYLEPCFIQSDTRAVWAKSINLSESGMCIAINEFNVLKRGARIAVFLQNFTPVEAQVRWTRGNIAGLGFDLSSGEHSELAAFIEKLQQDNNPVQASIEKPNIDDQLPDSLHEMLNPVKDTPDETQTPSSEDIDFSSLRAHKRVDYTEKCLIQTEKRTFQAVSKDISDGGMCLQVLGIGKLEMGSHVQIILEGGYPPINAILRWMKDRKVGIQFKEPITGHPVLNTTPAQA